MPYDSETMLAQQVDGHGRLISYLRLSVTDRCDLRCTYCMTERPVFLPKRDLLTPEELDQLAAAFIRRGVTKIRVTGGEPLVRKDIGEIFERLGRHVRTGGLRELTLTTNATQLAAHAEHLVRCGVRRVNVSLDSLDPQIYADITRGGRLDSALEGLEAAREAGLACKINIVALREQNADEIPSMIAWAHARGYEATVIEVMATADTGIDRRLQFYPLTALKDDLDTRWRLSPLARRTGGPARYWHVEETGGVLGLITPLTNNFCADCNRVRITSVGRLVLCLGQEDGVDLRAPMRGDGDLDRTIDAALRIKPLRHDFEEAFSEGRAAVSRPMSETGG